MTAYNRRSKFLTSPSYAIGQSDIVQVNIKPTIILTTSPHLPPLIPSKAFGPLILQRIFASEMKVLAAVLFIRALNACILQTSFVPDEYWQSTEVAHRWEFGYGYLTWEWQSGIRSPLYPALFYIPFKLLGLLEPVLSPWLMRELLTKIPHIVQGALSAVLGDFCLYQFSRRVAGQEVAQYCLVLHMANWFTSYCACRSLTNTMEMNLLCAALYFLPWPYEVPHVQKPGSKFSPPRHDLTNQWQFVLVASLAVVLRPTAAVFFVPLCGMHMILLWRHAGLASVAKGLLTYFVVGFGVFGVSLLADRLMYGEWVINQWEFVRVNVLQSTATLYGVHVWHWYLSQGIPAILATQTPLALAAWIYFLWRRIGRKETGQGATFRAAMDTAMLTVVVAVLAFSLQAHKEFRFVLPLLPLVQHMCACLLHRLSSPLGRVPWRPILVWGLVLTQLPIALYTLLMHQRGSLDTMRELNKLITKLRAAPSLAENPALLNMVKPSVLSLERGGEAGSFGLVPLAPWAVLFLTPCHAFPYYSHIHYKVNMRFLTCEPLDRPDEADTFFEEPVKWLRTELGDVRPAFLVTFHSLFESSGDARRNSSVGELLAEWNYWHCRTVFHAHITEGRYSRQIWLWCRRDLVALLR